MSEHHEPVGQRYPVRRREYCGSVGDLRHQNTVEVLKQLGFREIKCGNIHANGTDIIAKKDGKTLALEITNENTSSYINKSRALRTRKNLRGYRYKGLICSHGKMTLDAKPIMRNIPICRTGFQTLPKQYHSFYEDRNQTLKRKIANRKSLKQLKNAILSLLTKIKFTMPMYIDVVVKVSESIRWRFVGVVVGCGFQLLFDDSLLFDRVLYDTAQSTVSAKY